MALKIRLARGGAKKDHFTVLLSLRHHPHGMGVLLNELGHITLCFHQIMKTDWCWMVSGQNIGCPKGQSQPCGFIK